MNTLRNILYDIIQKDKLFYSIFLLLFLSSLYVLYFRTKKETYFSNSITGKNLNYIKMKFKKKYQYSSNKKNLQNIDPPIEQLEEIMNLPTEELRGSEGILKDSYIAKVIRKIEENKVYPQIELLMEREGIVIVNLVINKNGYIEVLDIIEGTTKNFIMETLSSIQRSQPFDPIPEDLQLDKLNFRIQVKYVLK